MSASTKRRSTRQAATRRRSIYAEPETDDDFDAGSEHDEYHDEGEGEELPDAPPPKKRKTNTRHRPQTRSKAKHSVKSSFRIGKPRRMNSKSMDAEEKKVDIPSDNKIPDWTLLPVDILRDIFIFASTPIHDQIQASNAAANVTWLMRSALTCRAFALPALEAYYQSPALLTTYHPHHFLDLLRIPTEKRYFDYNVKVKRLTMDVRRVAYVAHSRPNFKVASLISELPQLQHMEILHPRHLPPYRPCNIQKWTFDPMEMVQAMEDKKLRMRTWRWSRDMIPKSEQSRLYQMMTKAHSMKTFASVEHLIVCGFNVNDSAEPEVEEMERLGTPGLATAISKLPSLRDLTFVTCDVIMDKFLQRLPVNLERLELSNCLEITSDIMQTFFTTSASQLRELVLNHNAALNLSFLQGLKTSCPRLEVLILDLHYYSEKLTTNDAEPLYDNLLGEAEVPTWPSTLRHLSITHAQKLPAEGARNLFSSLIDAAPELPDLRHLTIHTHINIPWRDRVGFRDQWTERLNRVFLRKVVEPSKHLGSMKQFRLWQKSQRLPPTNNRDELAIDFSAGELSDYDIAPTSRRMSFVRISPHKPSGDTEYYDSSPAKRNPRSVKLTVRKPRRSTRVIVSHSNHSAESTAGSPPAEADDDSDSGFDVDEWRKTPEKFIQGLCEVVDVRIDNQRPREDQFMEKDFLDSEISGDEDWREGASGDEEEEGGYAW
ncbi:hypothetical protein TI39_contig55g00003 [Zymoseptoria brevis]|uniref:Uncharacterized protein n=1 Tax=Zymoseptoria brevis TaxID=1047168 RepID=A0A0F4GZC3_9PEZI|nr:hypothetical protein TI39_contig55g00003 [Zymoseptoria brevis]